LDDLMGKESGEGGVVGTTCCFRFARSREPFEKENECANGLERRQGGRIEGIEVVDDKRYTKRLEKLTAAQSRVNSAQLTV
jgi:hypothetical protein